MQHNNMQEHIVNTILVSCEQEENQKQITIHRNRDMQMKILTLKHIMEEYIETGQ